MRFRSTTKRMLTFATAIFPSANADVSAKPVVRRLLPGMTAILFLLIGSAYWGLLHIQENHLREFSLLRKQEAVGTMAELIDKHAHGMEAVLFSLLRDAELIAALKAGDREHLLELSTPLFDKLNDRYKVTHFYFSDAKRVCLLRVHNPGKYSDRFDRFTALEAERTGQIASGLELGPLGTFTLRVVHPVFENGHLLGYLELGKEIAEVLDAIVSTEGLEQVLAIRKDALDRTQWETGMIMLGREADWGRLPNHAIIYASIPFPAEANCFIGGNMQGHDYSDAADEIRFNSKIWRPMPQPITDATGHEVGELLLLHDVTEIKAAYQHFMVAAGIIAFVLLATLLALVFLMLRRTDEGIRAQQAELTEANARMIADITKRKQAEDELRESREHLEAMWNMMDVGVALIDAESQEILDVNPAIITMSGYAKEALVGKSCHHLLCPAAAGACPMNNLGKNIEHAERDLLHADGHLIEVEKTVKPMTMGGRIVYLETLIDISKRKEAEAGLRRLSTAIEQSPEAIVITDTEGTIEYVNPAFTKITGYTQEEAIGGNSRILRSGQHDQSFYTAMWKTLESGVIWSGQIINKRKDGALYTEEASIAPVKDSSGAITNFVAVKRDITEELQREEMFRQSQKLESIGRLAGGIAHDFNNLLTGIMGYTELCLENIADDHPIREWLDEIMKQGERTAALTHQLLAFARKQTIAPKVLDLNDTIVGMLNMVRRLIGEDIELLWKPGAGLWSVKLDPGQIDQILANLCVNARDAIDGGGKVTVETQNVTIDADYCKECTEAVVGDYVMLAISDDGCGMKKETQSHIFEPFFTTKGVGEGTGLGLATVYGIVKQNKGFVNIYSEPGKGTTFRIYLPRVAREDTGGAELQAASSILGGSETILLAEDEKSVRLMTTLLLEKLGYNVLAVDCPDAAIRKAEEYPGAIHLLITDVVMPGMNGRDLAAILTGKYPRLKCLFISGYTADIIAQRGILDEGVHFLAKPFARADISRKVREILDAD